MKRRWVLLALALTLSACAGWLPREPLGVTIAEFTPLEMSLLEQEHLRVILLDGRNRVLDIVEVYQGSVNSAQVRIAEVFKPAIACMASAIIVVHSHPSGDPTPSPEDVAVTRAIVQAGKLLDINTLDHLVIGHDARWVSMKERALGFS